MLTIPLLINGKPVHTSKTIEIHNPSTGKVIHLASSASPTEATSAVSAAQAAFPSWAETSPSTRRNIFLKAADLLEARTEEVGKWEEEEVGARPDYAGGFDVPTAVNGLRDVAGRISGIVGSVPVLEDPKRAGLVFKEPYGVILAIAPW